MKRGRRGGEDPGRGGSGARGDPRRGVSRRAARARRRRREIVRDLRRRVLAEPGVLLVLPQHGGVPLHLPRTQRHHAARDQLGLPALLQGLARQTGAKTAGNAREVTVSTTFLMAFALILVLDCVLPFVAPDLWRETFRLFTQ